MVIDIHAHTTTRVLEGILQKDATLDTLLAEMDKHGVEKTVLLASYFPHRGSGISNFRLLTWIKEHPAHDRFLMFGSLDVQNYFHQGMNELEELGKYDFVRGVKVYMNYQDINVGSEKMFALMALAESRQWPVMFHAGEVHHARHELPHQKPFNPLQLAVLADRFSNPIIVSHLGNPFVEETAALSRSYPHVYTDMSGLIESSTCKRSYGGYGGFGEEDPDDLDRATYAIKQYLAQNWDWGKVHTNLLFGTDFPVQTHEDSLRILDQGLKEIWPDHVYPPQTPYSDRTRNYFYNPEGEWEKRTIAWAAEESRLNTGRRETVYKKITDENARRLLRL